MSPAAASVRSSLFVQAGVTLAFGLLRAGSSGTWTAATVAIAVAAVGLGAALKATPTSRTAILGFEAAAVAFGVAGLAIEGYLVPGTVIGGFVLVRLAQTSVSEFCALPVLGPDGAALPGWQSPLVGAPMAPPGSVPPWAAQGAPIAPPTWPTPASPGPWPPAVPVAPGYATAPQGPLPVPPAVPAQQVPSGMAVAASLGQPTPFLPPRPGEHPAGRTVLPQPTWQPATQPAPAVAAAPAAAAPVALPAAPEESSALESAARELAQPAPAPVEKAPEQRQPSVPPVAPPCMTILPG